MATIKIEKELNDEFLRDVGITAVEGGIGYWSQIEGYGKFVNSLYVGDTSQKSLNPLNRLGKLFVIDDWTGEPDPEEPTHELTTELIAKGMQLVLDSGKWKRIASAILAEDAGDLDAGDADVIVQLGCFGEVVYG
jgi:hypothetical protein